MLAEVSKIIANMSYCFQLL